MDPAGFRELFVAEVAGLRRYVARHISDSRADDIVQATFEVAAAKLLDLPESRAGQRAWLYTTARFKMLKQFEADRRAATPLPDEVLAGLQQGEQDLADGVLNHLVASALFRSLPEDDRLLLLLVNVEGTHPREAAEVLGITETAVTSRMTRLRQRLSELLAESDLAPNAPTPGIESARG